MIRTIGNVERYDLQSEAGRFEAWCQIGEAERSTRSLARQVNTFLERPNLTPAQRAKFQAELDRLNGNLRSLVELQRQIWSLAEDNSDDFLTSGETCPRWDRDAFRAQRAATNTAGLRATGIVPVAIPMVVWIAGSITAVTVGGAIAFSQFHSGTMAYNETVREQLRALQRAGCGDPGADQAVCDAILELAPAQPESVTDAAVSAGKAVAVGSASLLLPLLLAGGAVYWFVLRPNAK